MQMLVEHNDHDRDTHYLGGDIDYTSDQESEGNHGGLGNPD